MPSTAQQAIPAGILEDLSLSRLMLGCAQFGMPYGIANRRGRPDYEEVREILACAFDGGVNCLDTAAAYGESEEVIGRAIRELKLGGRMVVITKVRHLPAMLSGRAIEAFVQRSVEDSLRRLRLESLALCLLHREEDFRGVEALLKLKEKGLVRHIGCSVTDSEPARKILDSGAVEAIQMPANLLDHRFTHAGLLRQAESVGIAMFVRSIYLQGLLLMRESEIPAALSAAIPARRDLQNLAAESGMTMAELALRFVLSLDGMTCAVVGLETVGQLRQNLEFLARGPLESGQMERIAKTVPEIPVSILKPGLWPSIEQAPA